MRSLDDSEMAVAMSPVFKQEVHRRRADQRARHRRPARSPGPACASSRNASPAPCTVTISEAMLNSVRCSGLRSRLLFRWLWANALDAATTIVASRAQRQQRCEVDRVRHRHRRAARRQRQLHFQRRRGRRQQRQDEEEQRLIDADVGEAAEEQQRPRGDDRRHVQACAKWQPVHQCTRCDVATQWSLQSSLSTDQSTWST